MRDGKALYKFAVTLLYMYLPPDTLLGLRERRLETKEKIR